MSFGMRCVLFATALLLAIAPAQADETWGTVRSADGSLQYEAPGELKTENYTDVDQGSPYSQTVFTSSSDTAVVMGMYTVYDDTFVAVDLNTIAAEFMKEIKATVTGFSLRPYRRGPGDSLPGVYATGETADLECEIWVIADGRLNYLMSVCTQRGDSRTALKQRVLNSVKITDIRTDADWTKVNDNGFHFVVPGKPKIEADRKSGTHTYLGRDGGIAAIGGSSYIPLPATSNQALDEALLNAAAQGFMDGNKMILISRELRPYILPSGKALPSMLFRAKSHDTSCAVRVTIGQGRVYILSACAVEGFEADAKVQRVLDSMAIDEQ